MGIPMAFLNKQGNIPIYFLRIPKNSYGFPKGFTFFLQLTAFFPIILLKNGLDKRIGVFSN